jgi:hypothetical protein
VPSAQAGKQYVATVDGAPLGILASLRVTLKTLKGEVVTERTAEGIAAMSGGMYSYVGVAPMDLGSYRIEWDNGADIRVPDDLTVYSSADDLVSVADFLQPGLEYTRYLYGAPPGIVGTLGATLKRPNNTVISARTTSGITEPEPGIYVFTAIAPEETGPVVLVWDDATPTPPVSDALIVIDLVPTDVTASLEEVAVHIMARTKDAYGNELGTFTADTRPTADQVRRTIVQAEQDVDAYIDTDLPTEAIPIAREAVAIRAAMIIERSYYPEQITANRSPYEHLRDEWRAIVGDSGKPGSLEKAVEREADEQEFGELPLTNRPAWKFGDDQIPYGIGRPL